MRAFLVICVIGAICFFTGFPNSVLGYLGIGASQYGISEDDPLGTPARIHRALASAGFDGDPGEENRPRTIVYSNPYDEKLYSGFPSALVVTVGEEEYVQKIEGVFVSTERGYSAQRPTMVEQRIVSLWKEKGGPKGKFVRVDEKPFVVPRSVKFGAAISIPQHHMESTLSNDEVKGTWVYSPDSPVEVMRIELK